MLAPSGVSGKNFLPSTAGIGSSIITYSFTDSKSCANTATQTILVESCTTGSIANTHAIEGISIGYDPTVSHIYIEYLTNEKSEITLYDINGKLVYKEFLSSDRLKHSIDASNWTKGLYILKIQTNIGSESKTVHLY